jgi:hypothetical protein
MMNTYEVVLPTFKTNRIYWKFLQAWVRYMQTGIWESLPRTWFDPICAVPKQDTLTPNEILEQYDLYLRNRRLMCERLGLCHLPHSDNLVKLHWLQKKDGERTFVMVPHTLMRVFVHINSVVIPGLRTNTSTPVEAWVDSKSQLTSFNDANQSIWPVEGTTKVEILKNSMHQHINR